MTTPRASALVIGILSAVWFAKSGADAIPPADMRAALGVLVGCAAAILGFLVSAGALLYAVANTTLARNMQRTGYFQSLLADLFIAAGSFFLSLAVGAINLFIPSTPSDLLTGFSHFEIGMMGFVFCNASAYFMLIPLGHRMWLLLSNLEPENPKSLE